MGMTVRLSDLIDPESEARLRALAGGDAAAPDAAEPESKAAGNGLEHKADSIGTQVLSADDETGVVEALVSVTGIEDRVKDIIEPGAYTKTMAAREPIGVWSHDDKTWVARTEDAVELMPGDPFFKGLSLPDGSPWPADAGAVKVKARFNLDTPHGKAAYSDVKFFEGKTSWSIGYRATKAFRNPRTGVRHIKELDWFEFSPVMVGAAAQAMTLSVKSLAQPVDADDATGIAPAELLEQLDASELGRLNELKASLGLEVKEVADPSESEAFLPCAKCGSRKVAKSDSGAVGKCADCGSSLTKKADHKDAGEPLETKARVRTPEGERRFKQPMGSVIIPDTLNKMSASDLKEGMEVSFDGGAPGIGHVPVKGKVEKVSTDGRVTTVTVDGKDHKLTAGSPVEVTAGMPKDAPIQDRDLVAMIKEAQDPEEVRLLRGVAGLPPEKRRAALTSQGAPVEGGGKPAAPLAGYSDDQVLKTYEQLAKTSPDSAALKDVSAEVTRRGLQDRAVHNSTGPVSGGGPASDLMPSPKPAASESRNPEAARLADERAARQVAGDRAANAAADEKVARDRKLAALNKRRRAQGKPGLLRLPGEVKDLDLAETSDVELDALITADVEAKALDPDGVEEKAMAHENLNRSPRSNWVEKAGQLPAYIQHIAKDINEQQGLPLDRAIPIAIGRVKKWARGGGGVKPDTVAKAQAAVAEWEALKAKAHAKFDSELYDQLEEKGVVAAFVENAHLIDTSEFADEPVESKALELEPAVDLAEPDEVLDMLGRAAEMKSALGLAELIDAGEEFKSGLPDFS